MTSWQTRLRQVVNGLRPQPDPDEAIFINKWLTAETRPLFERLAVHDRRHLVRVARELERLDPDNHDLIVAGLLHDVGKADDHDRVTMLERVANVVLGRVSYRLLHRLAKPDGNRFRRRLYLAVHHAERGAALAEQLGCNERTVWLIKNHEISDSLDTDLQRLVAIDGATP